MELQFITDYWSQILGLIFVVAWVNRQQALHENRIYQLEKKIETLYILHNSFQAELVKRGLSKLD